MSGAGPRDAAQNEGSRLARLAPLRGLRRAPAAVALALLVGCADAPPAEAPRDPTVSGVDAADNRIDASASDDGGVTDPPAGQGGFLGRLFGPAPAGSDADETPPEAVAAAAEAALDAAPGEAEDAAPGRPAPDGPPLLARLFGGGAASDPIAEDGPVPAFGGIARTCDTSSLGTQIARHPESGRQRYALFDTAPDTTAPRTFHVTGFDDGCARSFTAALAIFGELPVYEAIRFGAPGANQPVAEADAEYDRIKQRACGVGPDRPCGDRVRRLERGTVFVSIYERTGSNLRWKNLLLHDGQVAALDVKSR